MHSFTGVALYHEGVVSFIAVLNKAGNVEARHVVDELRRALVLILSCQQHRVHNVVGY